MRHLVAYFHADKGASAPLFLAFHSSGHSWERRDRAHLFGSAAHALEARDQLRAQMRRSGTVEAVEQIATPTGTAHRIITADDLRDDPQRTVLIDQSATLNLIREHGRLVVQLRNQPHKVAPLEQAHALGEIDGTPLYSPQADTLRMWLRSA